MRGARSGVARGTRLIGRDADVALVRRYLERGEALVTITGPVGVGKTALALSIIEQIRARPPEKGIEIHFCDLREVRDRAGLVAVVARTVGALESGQAASVTASALGSRPLVVVLDNFEQLVESAASLLSDW